MPHGRVMRRLRARAVPDRRIHRFSHLRVPEAGLRRRAAAAPPPRRRHSANPDRVAGNCLAQRRLELPRRHCVARVPAPHALPVSPERIEVIVRASLDEKAHLEAHRETFLAALR
jgi:hypothetical protein